jgi:hypothetical protein
MTADYAALEARVADLEQQMRHMLPQKIDAVSYGVGIMHAEMNERLDVQGEQLGRIELRLGEHGERLDSIDSRLAEILRRLPGGDE